MSLISIGSFRKRFAKARLAFQTSRISMNSQVAKGWGVAFNLINPLLRHVLKGMIFSTWAPQLSVLYLPCCDTHLCVSILFHRLCNIEEKRKKCVPKSNFWQADLPHSTTFSLSAAFAGAEQFPYPISFDFLPTSSCHGCDCDAVSLTPILQCAP